MAKKSNVYMQTASGDVFSTIFPEYHKECKQLARVEGERLYREQYRAEMLKLIKPGDTIYSVLRSVSGSGMSRRISFFRVDKKTGQIVCIDHAIAALTHYSQSDKGGLTVNGCGMDMGFAVVYDFGYVLWKNGTKKPHGTRNGQPDTCGGYALKNSWL